MQDNYHYISLTALQQFCADIENDVIRELMPEKYNHAHALNFIKGLQYGLINETIFVYAPTQLMTSLNKRVPGHALFVDIEDVWSNGATWWRQQQHGWYEEDEALTLSLSEQFLEKAFDQPFEDLQDYIERAKDSYGTYLSARIDGIKHASQIHFEHFKKPDFVPLLFKNRNTNLEHLANCMSKYSNPDDLICVISCEHYGRFDNPLPKEKRLYKYPDFYDSTQFKPSDKYRELEGFNP